MLWSVSRILLLMVLIKGDSKIQNLVNQHDFENFDSTEVDLVYNDGKIEVKVDSPEDEEDTGDDQESAPVAVPSRPRVTPFYSSLQPAKPPPIETPKLKEVPIAVPTPSPDDYSLPTGPPRAVVPFAYSHSVSAAAEDKYIQHLKHFSGQKNKVEINAQEIEQLLQISNYYAQGGGQIYSPYQQQFQRSQDYQHYLSYQSGYAQQYGYQQQYSSGYPKRAIDVPGLAPELQDWIPVQNSPLDLPEIPALTKLGVPIEFQKLIIPMIAAVIGAAGGYGGGVLAVIGAYFNNIKSALSGNGFGAFGFGTKNMNYTEAISPEAFTAELELFNAAKEAKKHGVLSEKRQRLRTLRRLKKWNKRFH